MKNSKETLKIQNQKIKVKKNYENTKKAKREKTIQI